MGGLQKERKPRSHLGCTGISEMKFQFMMVFFTDPIKYLSQPFYETRGHRKYAKHTRDLTACESLFWPGMQAAIQEKCLSCGLCA